MIGHVIIFKVDAVICVMLSMAEKHVLYRELVCTTVCIRLQRTCCTNRGYYNREQLYFQFFALTLHSGHWFANVFMQLAVFILRIK